MTNLQQGFPQLSTPLIDPATGRLTTAGQRFFLALWNRTGQAQGVSAATALQQAANLSDVNSVSTSRTNLGLGSSALLTAGIAANNAVQLDASARLPAVDGSQLSGVVKSVATAGLASGGPITGSGTVTVPAANAATTFAGTDATQALTSAGFAGNKNLAAQGHYGCPGKFLLNWGTLAIGASSSATFTFDQAFTSAGYFAVAVPNGSVLNQAQLGVTALTTTTMTVQNGSTGGITAYVFALGS